MKNKFVFCCVRVFVVFSLFAAQSYASASTTCDTSVRAVMSAYGRYHTYITPDTDLFLDYGLELPQISSVLLENWNECRIDLNVAYHALIHKICSTPKCISQKLNAGRY